MSIEAAFFGNLGRDAGSKTSKNGKPYLRLNVRIGDGEGAQWVSVTAFDESAIKTAEKFLKGARVYVEGRLSLDEWTGSDGAKRASLSCMSWHCRLAQIGRNRPRKQDTEEKRRNEPASTSGAAFGDALNDEIPF